MLRHCPLLVCGRSYIFVFGASGRWLTGILLRVLDHRSDTISRFLEAATRWGQSGRRGWPCVLFSSPPNWRKITLSPVAIHIQACTEKRLTPLHPASPTGTDTTPIGFVVPPTPLAASGFSRLHSTWWPYSFNKLHHCSSCCFPTSPS